MLISHLNSRYFLLKFYFLETAHEPSMDVLHSLEGSLGYTAGLVKAVLELIAIATVLFALVIILKRFFRFCNRSDFTTIQKTLRLELGRYLSLSLEFLLAADIVGTAVSPTWDALGKLAAVSGIRTFLNYFLEREIQQLEMDEHIKM